MIAIVEAAVALLYIFEIDFSFVSDSIDVGRARAGPLDTGYAQARLAVPSAQFDHLASLATSTYYCTIYIYIYIYMNI